MARPFKKEKVQGVQVRIWTPEYNELKKLSDKTNLPMTYLLTQIIKFSLPEIKKKYL